jgi:hypothetical protein
MAPVRGDVRTFLGQEIEFSSTTVRHATLSEFGSLRRGVRCTWSAGVDDEPDIWTKCFPDIPNLTVICRAGDCFAFITAAAVPNRIEAAAPNTKGAASPEIELFFAFLMFTIGGCLCIGGVCASLYHIRYNLSKLLPSLTHIRD